MDIPQDDSYQDPVHRFASAAEDCLAERFGGFWIDRSQGTPSLNIGVIEPTQADVEFLVRDATAVGWPINVFLARYSMKELMEFCERITFDILSESLLSLGPSPVSNRVELELSRADPELVARITALIPGEALRVCISPGVRIEPAAKPDP